MNNRLIFKDKFFSKISPMDYWRFVIDGMLQTEECGSLFAYEGRELGSVKSLLKAYAFMLDHVNTPVTEEFIKELHSEAVRCVLLKELQDKRISAGQYHTGEFEIIVGENGTEAGIEELSNGYPKEVHFALQKKTDSIFKLVPEVDDPKQLSIEVNKILDNYHREIKEVRGKALDEKQANADILKTILRCIKNLETTHPFPDGNCRTFCVLLLQKLLLENNFPPTILFNPNCFDGFTINELVKEVENGWEKVHESLSGKLMPSTLSLIKKQAEKWETNPIFRETKVSITNVMSTRIISLTSPLHFSVSLGIPEMVVTTLECVSDVNAKNDMGKTALMLAAASGDREIVNLLLKHPDININAQDQFGYTAAMFAAEAGNTELAKFLFEHEKSDKTICSVFGTTVGSILNNQISTTASCLELYKKITMLSENDHRLSTLQVLTQDVSAKQQELVNRLNLLLNSKEIKDLNLLEYIELYNLLKEIDQPLVAKNEFLQEIKNKILLDIKNAPTEIAQVITQALLEGASLSQVVDSDLVDKIESYLGFLQKPKVTDPMKIAELNRILKDIDSAEKLSGQKLADEMDKVAWRLFSILGECNLDTLKESDKARISNNFRVSNLEEVYKRLRDLDIDGIISECFHCCRDPKATNLSDIKKAIEDLIPTRLKQEQKAKPTIANFSILSSSGFEATQKADENNKINPAVLLLNLMTKV